MIALGDSFYLFILEIDSLSFLINYFIGSPYLARLHFNQVKSLHPQFPQIEIILEMLQDAQLLAAKHSSTIGLLTIQVTTIKILNDNNLLTIYYLLFLLLFHH